MAGKIGVKGEIVKKYLSKFPNTPNLTLAKTIYKEHNTLFRDVETIRGLIRMYTGQRGSKARKNSSVKTFFTKPKSLNPFNLPESHAEGYEPIYITSSKTLIISDLHFPYQHNEAITTALNYGKENGANCILINGDLIDFHNQSRFEKDPKSRSTFEEFESVRQFLAGLRKAFPKARIIFKEGNHDERWEKWLYVKAPELFGDSEFMLENRLKLNDFGIEIVKDKLPIKLGKLTVLHGHELNGSGGVNPARATFLKTIDNVLIGHCHRSSQHTEPTMSGDVIVTTSQGCLCGMYPGYARVNKWNLGFSFCELNVKTGEYILHNLKIINGKVY